MPRSLIQPLASNALKVRTPPPWCRRTKSPPGPGAARGRELRPPAPQERAAAVPPDLDAPDLDPAAGRADDAGLPGGDPLGELVGNARRV